MAKCFTYLDYIGIIVVVDLQDLDQTEDEKQGIH